LRVWYPVVRAFRNSLVAAFAMEQLSMAR
jgi:hypothetical protein